MHDPIGTPSLSLQDLKWQVFRCDADSSSDACTA